MKQENQTEQQINQNSYQDYNTPSIINTSMDMVTSGQGNIKPAEGPGFKRYTGSDNSSNNQDLDIYEKASLVAKKAIEEEKRKKENSIFKTYSDKDLNYEITDSKKSNDVQSFNLSIISITLILFCSLCYFWMKIKN
jgi:hypothetical protein